MPNQALRVATSFEQHCQIVVGIRVRRVEFEAALIASLSVFKAAQFLERYRAIEVQHGSVGEVSQCLVEYMQRVFATRFEFTQQRTQVNVGGVKRLR